MYVYSACSRAWLSGITNIGENIYTLSVRYSHRPDAEFNQTSDTWLAINDKNSKTVRFEQKL
jgi:hypothetical protein